MLSFPLVGIAWFVISDLLGEFDLSSFLKDCSLILPYIGHHGAPHAKIPCPSCREVMVNNQQSLACDCQLLGEKILLCPQA